MSDGEIESLLPGLHIILGDSAGGTFTRIYRARERLLVDQDVLSCGPIPATDDLRAWSKARDDYWSALVPGADLGHVSAPFNLVSNAESLRLAEHTCTWAATSLSEQLFIAHVIRLADLVGSDPAQMSIIQFETLRGSRKRVLGMGELNEESMRDHPEPATMSNEVLADYRTAWRALVSGDPTGFERFASDRPLANTWIKTAMRLMLNRLPDVRTGLSHWDSTLLGFVRSHGPRAARIIGYTMGGTFDDGDITGDWYLFGRLLRLGDERLPKPLLALTGDRTEMRTLNVVLTPFGEAVLDGKASNYPTNPIEDWVGGTSLSSAQGKLWFNDGGKVIRGQ